jgi:hypothetical protein
VSDRRVRPSLTTCEISATASAAVSFSQNRRTSSPRRRPVVVSRRVYGVAIQLGVRAETARFARGLRELQLRVSFCPRHSSG